MNTLFNPTGSDTRKSVWKWQFLVQCESSEQKIGLTLRQEGTRWKAEVDELDAALSLWLYSANTESGKILWPAEFFPEKENRDSQETASQSPKSKKMDESGLNPPSAVRGKRSLGLTTPHLERDLAWWVPKDLLRTSKLNKDGSDALNINNRKVSSLRDGTQAGSLLNERVSHRHGEDNTGEAGNTHNENQIQLLAVDFNASQKLLYAQSLFSLFMRAVAEKLEDPVEGGTDELLPGSATGGGSWKKLQLRNNTLSRMVQDVHQTGLGSLPEIYTSVVTPLSRAGKLPRVDKVVEWVREHAEMYARLEDWQRTGDCLQSLLEVVGTPSTLARAEGILWDHLRRAISVKKFQKEQSLEQEKSTVNSLTDLQKTLRPMLITLRDRQKKLAHQDTIDLARIFDPRRDNQKTQFPLLPAEITEDTVLFGSDCDGSGTYPEAFQFTSWHGRALSGSEEDERKAKEYAQRGDANSKDILDRTPAHYVAANPRLHRLGEHRATRPLYIKGLKEAGADLNAQDLLGWTPLHYACWASETEQIEELIEAGVFLDHQARDGTTPLHCAVSSGCQDGVSLLVERGAAIDMPESQGNLPIHLAAYRGHSDIVKILQSGSRNLQDRFGRIALHQGALAGQRNVINIFDAKDLEARDRIDQTPLSLAARMGQLDCTQALLDQGAKIHSQDRSGRTALHCAAFLGHEDCIGILLKEGIDINSRDRNEQTPLHLAAGSGHVACVRRLLENHADMNSSDDMSNTPLHSAANMGHADCIRELLERVKGAKIDAKNGNLETPLHLAVESGHADCTLELLRKGANVRITNDVGELALHNAVRLGKLEIVQMLLTEDDMLNQGIRLVGAAWTPLMIAAQHGHADILKFLVLKKEADLESRDSEGATALQHAIYSEYPESIETLIKLGADIEAHEEYETSTVEDESSSVEDERSFVEVGRSIVEFERPIQEDEMTPLMSAASVGNVRAVELLLASAANVNHTIRGGRTALTFAQEKKHKEIIDILQSSRQAVLSNTG